MTSNNAMISWQEFYAMDYIVVKQVIDAKRVYNARVSEMIKAQSGNKKV